jgi:hypothetical protein
MPALRRPPRAGPMDCRHARPRVAARDHNVVVVARAPHVVAAACGQAPATVLSVAAAPVEGIAAGTAGAAAVSVVTVPSTAATSANRIKDARVEVASTRTLAVGFIVAQATHARPTVPRRPCSGR